jgi:hypothetical protein
MEWPVHGGRGSAGTGTPCAERAPVNLRLGGAKSERGVYGQGLGRLYRRGRGCGRGVGCRATRRARGRATGHALALLGRVEHVAVSFYPSSSSCLAAKRANLAIRLL